MSGLFSQKNSYSPPVSVQQVEQPADYLGEAQKAMALTPEETSLYQRHLANLRGTGGIDNPNGSRSTLSQATIEVDDRQFVVPTVWEGKRLKGKDLFDRLKKEGIGKFPSYESVEEAEKRYGEMHQYMEKDTADFLRNRKEKPKQ